MSRGCVKVLSCSLVLLLLLLGRKKDRDRTANVQKQLEYLDDIGETYQKAGLTIYIGAKPPKVLCG